MSVKLTVFASSQENLAALPLQDTACSALLLGRPAAQFNQGYSKSATSSRKMCFHYNDAGQVAHVALLKAILLLTLCTSHGGAGGMHCVGRKWYTVF